MIVATIIPAEKTSQPCPPHPIVYTFISQPRHPAGSSKGGQFASKKGVAGPTVISTTESADAWGDGYNPHFTPDEQNALENYKETLFEDTNKGLREHWQDAEGGIVADMDSAFEHATPLDSDTKVFRGLDDAFDPTMLSAGDIIQDEAFMSTSLVQSNADIIATEFGTRVEITAPRGTKAIFMEDFAGSGANWNESELLFNRKTKMRVDEVIDTGKLSVVRATIVVE
jgi:hypothetical protein